MCLWNKWVDAFGDVSSFMNEFPFHFLKLQSCTIWRTGNFPLLFLWLNWSRSSIWGVKVTCLLRHCSSCILNLSSTEWTAFHISWFSANLKHLFYHLKPLWKPRCPCGKWMERYHWSLDKNSLSKVCRDLPEVQNELQMDLRSDTHPWLRGQCS